MSYCYFILGEYTSCVFYLETVIFHFNQICEDLHQIKINQECKYSNKLNKL